VIKFITYLLTKQSVTMAFILSRSECEAQAETSFKSLGLIQTHLLIQPFIVYCKFCLKISVTFPSEEMAHKCSYFVCS